MVVLMTILTPMMMMMVQAPLRRLHLRLLFFRLSQAAIDFHHPKKKKKKKRKDHKIKGCSKLPAFSNR
jgi:hypothetical protein